MNRKIILGIGVLIALCCICSAVSLGILFLIGSSGSLSDVPARCASVPSGSPDALLTDPLGGFARTKIGPATPGYQALYKGRDGTVKVNVMKFGSPAEAKFMVRLMRDGVSVLKPPTFSERMGIGPCDEFKYAGLGGEDRAGMAWNNSEWFFIVSAQSLTDRDAMLKALPY